MLPSLDEYLHILSRDTADQKILQSHWMRGVPSLTQPKLVVLHASFS